MSTAIPIRAANEASMPHVYDDAFFRWVNLTATRSARALIPHIRAAVTLDSVVDFGCGQGAWLAEWRAQGIADILGIDGSYVERERLVIPADLFVVADLTKPQVPARGYDLAQSLEVAEHLPPEAAETFVAGLCAASDVVLFSAAQPGQGGEAHLNERTPSFWAGVFARHGYAAYDAIRPGLAADRTIAPWYKYNTIVYANDRGKARLAPAALARRCDDLRDLDAAGDLGWKLRRLLLKPLPEPVVTRLSRLRYRVACALERGDRAA